MMIAALFVLPVMDYTLSVLRSGEVRSDITDRTESVKGGLRAALYDPVALYQACVASGRTTAVELAVPPGLGIRSYCTTTQDALQDVPSDQRWAIALTQVGANSALPPNYVAPPETPELDGTIGIPWCTSMDAAPDSQIPCGRVFPGSGDSSPTAWQSAATDTTQGGQIFFPSLPPFQNTLRSNSGYMMPGSPACRIYFPGRYTDDVVIADNTPTYFVSGVYYFERALRISGNAQVVAGTGSMPGCVESDAVAVADAINAPFDATSNGVGATFVFGLNGRLVIDTSTSGSNMSFVMNRRLVAQEDPLHVLNDVSIMSVNGVFLGSSTTRLIRPELNVPVSPVQNGGALSPEPWTHFYRASNLVSTPTPAVGCALPLTNVTANCPIVDVNMTSAATVTVRIPGYISIPMGSMVVNGAVGSSANKSLTFGGGILAAQMQVTGEAPDFLQLGLLNPVVQKTFKIVTETTTGSPEVISTALVQVNETGGHAINSWVVQTVVG
jgi:hypothetical protein